MFWQKKTFQGTNNFRKKAVFCIVSPLDISSRRALANDHLPKKFSKYFNIFLLKKNWKYKRKISELVSRPTLNLNCSK